MQPFLTNQQLTFLMISFHRCKSICIHYKVIRYLFDLCKVKVNVQYWGSGVIVEGGGGRREGAVEIIAYVSTTTIEKPEKSSL